MSLGSNAYVCGWCGERQASSLGFIGVVPVDPNNRQKGGTNEVIHICSHCGHPTAFFEGKQYPAPRLGKEIAKLPPKVAAVYNEIRDCTAAGAYLSCVGACRVLLMHIAKEQANVTAASFKQAIEAIEAAGYITAKMAPWVHKIRDKGNDINHDLIIPKKEEAEEMVKLVETLLVVIYELT